MSIDKHLRAAKFRHHFRADGKDGYCVAHPESDEPSYSIPDPFSGPAREPDLNVECDLFGGYPMGWLGRVRKWKISNGKDLWAEECSRMGIHMTQPPTIPCGRIRLR